MVSVTVAPAGYAANAAELLDAAADDREGLAVRQLAATQAIGYALLALGDQVSDLSDAVTDLRSQLGDLSDISDSVADIAASLERHRLAHWFTAVLASLRACWGKR